MIKKSTVIAILAFIVVIAAIGSVVKLSFEEPKEIKMSSTNHSEMSEFIKKSNIGEATFWLNLARNSPEEGSSGVYKVILTREYAEKANVTLEELGTTEEELQEIERKSHIYLAKFFLDISRKNSASQSVETEVSFVKEDAKKGGLSISDLGTSEEELNGLVYHGYINEAKSLLVTVRKYAKVQPIIMEIHLIKENTQKANVTLEEMGTSEEELKKLEEENEYFIKIKNGISNKTGIVTITLNEEKRRW